MKTHLRIINLFYLLLLLASSAKAHARGVFLEPYVGLAKQEVHFSNQADIANGFALGAKVGFYISNKLYLGGDYLQGGPYDFGDDLGDAQLTNTMMGVGLGADYKIIRFWAGYYFDNEFVIAETNSKFIGSAIKVGLGLVASRKLRANLDLIFHEMTEAQTTSVFSSYTGTIDGVDFITTMVSVSFPVDL